MAKDKKKKKTTTSWNTYLKLNHVCPYCGVGIAADTTITFTGPDDDNTYGLFGGPQRHHADSAECKKRLIECDSCKKTSVFSGELIIQHSLKKVDGEGF